MKWKRIEKEFEQYKALFGMKQNCVRLVTPMEYEELSGRSLGHFFGKVDRINNIVTVRRNKPIRVIRNVIVHELAHCLFPSKSHWWIECFSYRIIPVKYYDGQVGRYTKRYCHTPDELPSKKRLIEMANKAAEQLQL